VKGSSRALTDEERELKTAVEEERAVPGGPTEDSKDDEDDLTSTELEEPVAVRGRSSLPSAPPSPVSRQCLAVALCSACLLLLLFVMAVVVAYSRWVAAPTHTTPAPDAGDPGTGGQKLHDRSGCDSLLSFTHCADSDMFG